MNSANNESLFFKFGLQSVKPQIPALHIHITRTIGHCGTVLHIQIQQIKATYNNHIKSVHIEYQNQYNQLNQKYVMLASGICSVFNCKSHVRYWELHTRNYPISMIIPIRNMSQTYLVRVEQNWML